MKPTPTIFFVWLAWVFIVLGFQAWTTERMALRYPDRALDWTTQFTGSGYQQGHPFLLEPFMNRQVAWDSEYYLAIAVGGYNDARSPHLTPNGVVTNINGSAGPPSDTDFFKSVSLSYAFFPFYPLLIRIFAFPLQILGMNPIATAALAGVIVSALGTLLGMLALYDLSRGLLGEDAALRAVFYLIVFPTGFFLLQVYTEGLFVGLAFACLAMLRRGNWLAAALLGVAATLTRAVGVALVIPLLIVWFKAGEWRGLDWRSMLHGSASLRPISHLFLAFAPLAAFLVWKFSYLGRAFDYIQTHYFSRGFLSLETSFHAWSNALQSLLNGSQSQQTAYYFTEFMGIGIALLACIVCIKLSPELGWYSLAVLVISWGSGPAQGMHRYILAAPAVFIVLAKWGRNPVFDRAWTLISILLMGALAMLFAFDMWVA